MRASAAALALLFLASCAGGGGGGDADRAGGTGKGQICALTGIVADGLDKRELDLTFTEIVNQTEQDVVNAGVSAIIGMALADQEAEPTKDSDLGPYLPALTYLAVRGTAWDPEPGAEVEEPERTREVVESAERLDEDLAEGLCKR